ncbi:hypothetical protein [uncultured Umboniibacter sp.]|uniref:hypothetical protein n=1 Tax=uncultured Umboniibacter sp. TaxID=1798917 RepID=UPI002601C847|nr:hypothetical protein [uncultured Umboniibacter sp.]
MELVHNVNNSAHEQAKPINAGVKLMLESVYQRSDTRFDRPMYSSFKLHLGRNGDGWADAGVEMCRAERQQNEAFYDEFEGRMTPVVGAAHVEGDGIDCGEVSLEIKPNANASKIRIKLPEITDRFGHVWSPLNEFILFEDYLIAVSVIMKSYVPLQSGIVFNSNSGFIAPNSIRVKSFLSALNDLGLSMSGLKSMKLKLKALLNTYYEGHLYHLVSTPCMSVDIKDSVKFPLGAVVLINQAMVFIIEKDVVKVCSHAEFRGLVEEEERLLWGGDNAPMPTHLLDVIWEKRWNCWQENSQSRDIDLVTAKSMDVAGCYNTYYLKLMKYMIKRNRADQKIGNGR